jgi:hypothetical protein
VTHRLALASLVIAASSATVACTGCGAMNLARTVGRGNAELVVSSGGPLLAIGSAVFPTPQVRIGGRYGATDDVDLLGHVALDTVAAAFVALDAGVVGQMVRARGGFAMSLSARLHAVIDLDDAVAPRVLPEVGLHLEHPLHPSLWLFFGVAGLAQLEAPAMRPFLFVSPYLGLEARFDPQRDPSGRATEQAGLALQLGWINPWESDTSLVRFVPDGAGALTVVLAFRHRFGGIDR